MSDSEPVVVGFPTTPTSTNASPSLIDDIVNGVDDIGDSWSMDPPCIVGMGMLC
jgi:hypothetical protein